MQIGPSSNDMVKKQLVVTTFFFRLDFSCAEFLVVYFDVLNHVLAFFSVFQAENLLIVWNICSVLLL